MEEVSVLLFLISTLVLLISVLIWKLMNWIWFRPKRLEKLLREQGLKGTTYCLLFGDLTKELAMLKKTLSTPINFSDDVASRIFPLMVQSVKEYGKDYYFTWIGPTPRLVVMNPEYIKDIFVKIGSFENPSYPLAELLISGIVLSNGEKWAKHRKIINPAFRMEKLKSMIPAFHLSCMDMLNKWENLANQFQGRCELDVWPYLQNMAGDVISRTAFGSSFEVGTRIFNLQTEKGRLFLELVKYFFIPGWRFMPTKLNKRMGEINREIKDLLTDMIHEREKAMERGEAPNDDLLGTLLSSNQEYMKEQNGHKTNVGMSISDVIDECKLFYFAGQESTSVLLVWTMVLLSKFPNWQAQAREEVFKVFGYRDPDFDGLLHLKVVTMILNEVLRLYPPASFLLRKINMKTQLGNLTLPGGIEVYVPTILLHYDTDLWGEDAKEFNPQRFAEGVSKATKGRLSYFPFAWGPRVCPGQNYAMIEAKMALALILQRFTFDLSPSYTHAPMNVITLQPQHGAYIILNKI